MAPCTERSSCTDDTGNRTDSTGSAGIPAAPFHEPFHARRRASSHGGNARHRSTDVTERSGRDSRSAIPLTRPGKVLHEASPGTARVRGIPPRWPLRPGRRHHPARRPGRGRPAVLRRTRPGSPHRHSPGIWDGQRQMPAAGRLVRGIMPAAGDQTAVRARHDDRPCRDPGTASPVPAGSRSPAYQP